MCFLCFLDALAPAWPTTTVQYVLRARIYQAGEFYSGEYIAHRACVVPLSPSRKSAEMARVELSRVELFFIDSRYVYWSESSGW